MPSPAPFASFFIYSPRGTSEPSRKSREIRDAIKFRAEPGFLDKVAAAVAVKTGQGVYGDFFGPRVVMVPAPRSAPFKEGWLWPGERIAEAMVRAGLGSDVQRRFRRIAAVPKAATARAGERPTVAKHMETIVVDADLTGAPERFIIVDDVVTKGAMLYACAQLLRAAYPNADVRVFAPLRTMGLVAEVPHWIEPVVGTISLNRWGDPDRQP